LVQTGPRVFPVEVFKEHSVAKTARTAPLAANIFRQHRRGHESNLVPTGLASARGALCMRWYPDFPGQRPLEAVTMTKLLKANAFSKDLCEFLNSRRALRERFRLDWQTNYYLKDTRDCVDVVALRDGRPVVLIEVELHREDPASNVAKIWMWAQKSKRRLPLVVFHAFSKLYQNRKERRKDRAVFLGVAMERKVPGAKYRPLNLKYNPRPGGRYGAGRRERAALLLGRRIASQCSRLLVSRSST
jgi:hypothetical protein